MNKKYLLFLILLICAICFNSNAQNSRWLWASQFSDSLDIIDQDNLIKGIAVDYVNNVLLSIDYYSKYTYKIAVAKVSANGNILFKKVIDYDWYIYTEKIITDNVGNYYLAGKWGLLNDTLNLDTLNIDNRKFCRIGGFDVFVIKYNLYGEIIWAQTYGSKKNEYLAGMYIALNGNLYASVVADGKRTNLFFNSVGDIVKTNNDDYIHIFNIEFYYNLDIDTFRRYDNNQKLIYQISSGLKSSSGVWSNQAKGSSKYFYSVGYFENLEWDTTSYISQGNNDLMIGKFDTLGKLYWIKTIGGKLPDFPIKIILDKNENIYVFIQRPLYNVFDSLFIDSDFVIYGNGMSFFKFDSSGNFIFADHVNDASGSDMTIDKDDKLYFSGYLTDTARFGNNKLYGINKLFLAKYDTGFVSIYENKRFSHKVITYPNPITSGYFYVQSEDIKNQKVTISVYDLLGKQVFSHNYDVKDQLNQIIQLSNVPKGIYIIKLAGNEKCKYYTSKLILN